MQEVPAPETEIELEEGDVEHPDNEHMVDSVDMHKDDFAGLASQDRVNLLETIHDASPRSRRSKRRVHNADQANLERDEKMKAAHNLDASFNQGTNDTSGKSFLHFTREHVVDNLKLIGVNLGNGDSEICNVVDRIKSLENDICIEKFTKDEVATIFDLYRRKRLLGGRGR
jgi:hypothetical protein